MPGVDQEEEDLFEVGEGGHRGSGRPVVSGSGAICGAVRGCEFLLCMVDGMVFFPVGLEAVCWHPHRCTAQRFGCESHPAGYDITVLRSIACLGSREYGEGLHPARVCESCGGSEKPRGLRSVEIHPTDWVWLHIRRHVILIRRTSPPPGQRTCPLAHVLSASGTHRHVDMKKILSSKCTTITMRLDALGTRQTPHEAAVSSSSLAYTRLARRGFRLPILRNGNSNWYASHRRRILSHIAIVLGHLNTNPA